jgi:superfamily II DNA or RNA helicase
MIQLRPHQMVAIDALRDSLRAGNKRVILSAPCSMGKTIIAACYIAVNEGRKEEPKGQSGVFLR